MMKKNFLTLLDLSPDTLRGLITRGIELKALRKAGTPHESLQNRVLAMIFEKSSTRTRMSFEAGMAQLGGTAIFLSPRDTQQRGSEQLSMGRNTQTGDSWLGGGTVRAVAGGRLKRAKVANT